MPTETWYSRAVPILEAVGAVEGTENAFAVQLREIAEQTQLDANDVAIEVERLLEGGYLAGELTKVAAGGDVGFWYLSPARLAPDGARVVGMWPSADSYEALVGLLERKIDEATDEGTRSRFRKVLDTITALGKEVGTNVIANILVEFGRRGF